MKNIIIFSFLIFSLPSMATVTCIKTITGTTYCTGTDSAGRTVDTQTTTTITGTTTTTGKEGDKQVNRECHTTITGTTYCN